jgi:hypothetical protein
VVELTLFAIDSFCEVGTGDNRSFVLLAHPSCETGVGGVCEGGLIDWSFSELELDWNCVCEHIANTFVLETLPVAVSMVTHKTFQENRNALVLPLPETKPSQPHLVNGGPFHILLLTDESLAKVRTVSILPVFRAWGIFSRNCCPR